MNDENKANQIGPNTLFPIFWVTIELMLWGCQGGENEMKLVTYAYYVCECVCVFFFFFLIYG